MGISFGRGIGKARRAGRKAAGDQPQFDLPEEAVKGPLLPRLWRRRNAARLSMPDLGGLRMEALEPRYLLSADLMPLRVDLADVTGHGVNLRYDRVTDSVVVESIQTGKRLASALMTQINYVAIAGSANADTLRLDFSDPFTRPVDIRFEGGAGADRVEVTGGTLDRLELSATATGSTLTATTGTASATVTMSAVETVQDRATAAARIFADRTDQGNAFRLSGQTETTGQGATARTVAIAVARTAASSVSS